VTRNPNGYAIQRAAPRFAISLPIEWSPQQGAVARRLQGRTRDISVRGVYFFGALQQPIGLRLSFTVPYQYSDAGHVRPFLKGVGSVVRCEELGSSHREGAFGIAVKIDEIIPE